MILALAPCGEWAESMFEISLTVTRQPGRFVDLADWPIQALSRVDCFHPSEAGHRRVAAGLWNRLTLTLVRILS